MTLDEVVLEVKKEAVARNIPSMEAYHYIHPFIQVNFPKEKVLAHMILLELREGCSKPYKGDLTR